MSNRAHKKKLIYVRGHLRLLCLGARLSATQYFCPGVKHLKMAFTFPRDHRGTWSVFAVAVAGLIQDAELARIKQEPTRNLDVLMWPAFREFRAQRIEEGLAHYLVPGGQADIERPWMLSDGKARGAYLATH